MPELTALARESVEHALASIEGGGPLIPIVVLDLGTSKELLRVVVASSEQAQLQGHKLIRARSDAKAYCSVTDVYASTKAGRQDALLIEQARRDCPRAELFLQLLDDQGLRVGELQPFGTTVSAFEPVDPHDLDWGAIQPDIVTRDDVAVHVVNHNFAVRENEALTVRFVCARMRHYKMHLPPEVRQAVHVDDRGQSLGADQSARIRAAFEKEGAVFVKFSTEMGG
ncbi:MAG TPA: hypothetical protein VGK67_17655 [Myxococcales bacterium]|jgi:hypothetical protein